MAQSTKIDISLGDDPSFPWMTVPVPDPEPSVSKFCEKCLSIFQCYKEGSKDKWPNWDADDVDDPTTLTKQVEHHHSVAALEASAAAGCQLCFMMRAQLADREIRYLESKTAEPVVGGKRCNLVCLVEGGMKVMPGVLLGPDGLSMSETLDRHEVLMPPETHVIWMRKAKGPGSELGGRGSSPRKLRRPAKNTGSQQCMEIASGWLEDCLANHKCHPLIGASDDPAMGRTFLGSLVQPSEEASGGRIGTALEKPTLTLTSSFPARLIDTGDSISQAPRLVNSQEFVQTPAYMTLSHCWGQQSLFTLTKSNRKTLETIIPVENLSTTFKHALKITRLLGHRYLWIDSLCIVQDDEADWETESLKMTSVYSHSVLTIAATHASNGSEGCFIDRQVRCSEGCYFPESLIHEDARADSYYCCIDEELPSREIDNAPLNSRAWVLQERLLSPRILHFGKNQIHWSCLQGYRSESYPHMLEPTRSLFRSFWPGTVYKYTGAALTRPSDKLVAISGLAKLQHAFAPKEYVAGLWKSESISQLSWFVLNGEQQPRPATYRAPSWSWAAVDGQIEWGITPIDEHFCSISEMHIDLASDDPFGKVSGGYVRIRGTLLRFPPPSVDETILFDTNMRYFSPSLDYIYMTFYADTKDWPKDETLYMCLLGKEVDFQRWHALILKPTGHQKGQLQRIGAVASSDSGMSKIGGESFHEDIDSSVFESREAFRMFGFIQYTFTIV